MTEFEDIDIVKKRLGQRSIVLVGLMGCGKSSIGKRLAVKLGLPFVDADEEIERAAAKSINDIFADHGEAQFPRRRAQGHRAPARAADRRCWQRAAVPS